MATFTPEDLSQIRPFLSADVEPDAALGVIVGALKAAQATATEAAEAVNLSRRVEELDAELATEKTAREAAESRATEAVSLSRRPAELSDTQRQAIGEWAEVYEARIDKQTTRGDMPNFVADKLKSQIGTMAKPNVVMLSRAAGNGVRPIDEILELFDGSGLGIKSDGSTSLSRTTPPKITGTKPDDQAKPEDVEAARAAYGLPAKTA